MQLLAIAGGVGPSGETWLVGCGCFPVLPLVAYLAGRAVIRCSIWPAVLALVLAGVPFLILSLIVAGYRPSDDGDVLSDQMDGVQALGFYAALAGIAGLALLTAWGRRIANAAKKRHAGSKVDFRSTQR